MYLPAETLITGDRVQINDHPCRVFFLEVRAGRVECEAVDEVSGCRRTLHVPVGTELKTI